MMIAVPATLLVLLITSGAAKAGTASGNDVPTSLELPSRVLRVEGPEKTLITNEQRAILGIKNGPDSIADFWELGPNEHYLLFSGARRDGSRGTFRLQVDSGLNRIVGPLSPESVRVVLRSGLLEPNPHVAGNASGYHGFDRDYSGGGTTVALPCGTDTEWLYVYHGENHTDINGTRYHGSEQGWTGIGLAHWDRISHRFVKESQIAGLGQSNRWVQTSQGRRTQQRPPISGNPSGYYKEGYVYAYFGDLAAEPEYGPRAYLTVARAPAQEVCADVKGGPPVQWKKFNHGVFESPSVYPRDTGSGYEAGTGGASTPLYERRAKNAGESVPNVEFVETEKVFLLTALEHPRERIVVRYSSDGLRWSVPQELVPGLPEGGGFKYMYPRINVAYSATGRRDRLVLTYVRKKMGKKWEHADLMRQELKFMDAPPHGLH